MSVLQLAFYTFRHAERIREGKELGLQSVPCRTPGCCLGFLSMTCRTQITALGLVSQAHHACMLG